MDPTGTTRGSLRRQITSLPSNAGKEEGEAEKLG
jgi:hypothetical protein